MGILAFPNLAFAQMENIARIELSWDHTWTLRGNNGTKSDGGCTENDQLVFRGGKVFYSTLSYICKNGILVEQDNAFGDVYSLGKKVTTSSMAVSKRTLKFSRNRTETGQRKISGRWYNFKTVETKKFDIVVSGDTCKLKNYSYKNSHKISNGVSLPITERFKKLNYCRVTYDN